jgi:hypothetical protein
MSKAHELVQAVEANGGKLHVEDGRLRCENADAIAPFLDELGGCKDAVIQLVRERGTASASSQVGEDCIQALIRKRRERP